MTRYHTSHDHAGHHHGDGHYSHAPEIGENNERVVLAGFALIFGFMVAEFIGGILSGSLALVADAGHMLTDAAALALAWAGFRFGRKLSDSRRTFGYMRLEVLAGFVNAITLFGLVAWITYEAIQRLFTPHPVLAGPMMVVAVLGLVVNIAVFFMLRQGDTSHVNIRGALLHVLGDLLGSVAAIAAAVVIYLTGWTPIDPILSVLLSMLILRSAWALLRNAVQILMEGTPGNIEIDALRTHVLDTVPDIEDISHVHVWSITSGKPAATMEVSLKPRADYRTISERVKRTLAQRYAIGHATVEINWANHPKDCPLSEPTHDH
ncbi:cation diffusion facilitator family transporter [Pelagibacterium sp.]|uniref:cation diffusion facilitator family transporter n=1 Tax=Pelagibacterium sp. TaxID=1967288 RepID=UPI003BA8F48B